MSAFPLGFSGSYDPADVTFLLTPVVVDFVDVAAKEALIQSGRKHYSEMLAREKPPSPEYMAVFHQAFAANRDRVGRDVARLAKALAARGEDGEIVLVSLARAGTPIGVLLRRALVALGRMAVHYSVSIIRDRGIDPLAMAAILARHDPASIVFVDGWTGKGAIGGELARAMAGDFPQLTGAPLCVLSDLAGVATLAAGDEDYVIPSAILNGIISGLISRTVLSDDLIAPGNFHGCMLLDDLADLDLSRWYVDEQMNDVRDHLPRARAADWSATDRARAAAISTAFVEAMMQRTGITDRNRVKPGIGEATRALLRRMPERLFLRDPQDGDVGHLVALASSKGIAVETLADLPYSACAIIKTLGDA